MTIPSKLRLELEISRNSFKYFCKFILNQKLGAMHEEWIDLIENSNRNIALIAPRGHFKTSILSVAYPLWHLYRPHKKPQQILIQSSTLQQSSEIMRLIKRQLEQSPVLSELLMPENLHDTTWSQKTIIAKGEHMISSITYGDTVKGFHPNLSILDDVLRTETTNVDEAKKIFYDAVFPITQDKPITEAKQIVVGTPISYADLLMELEHKYLYCPVCKTSPAIIDGKCHVCTYVSAFKVMHYSAIKTDEAGKWLAPTFPEHYTLEQLKNIRENVSSLSWSRNFLCKPMSDSSSVFPYEMVLKPAIELHKEVTRYERKDEGQEKVLSKYLGIDVAMGDSSGADYTVFIGLDKEEGKPLVLSYFERRKGMSSTELISRTEQLHELNNYARIAIEKIGLGFGPTKEMQFNPKTMSAIFPVNYKGSQQRVDEMLGRLELAFRNKGIAIPEEQVLIDELQQMIVKEVRGKQQIVSVGAHNDCVSALALALYAAEIAIPVSATLI